MTAARQGDMAARQGDVKDLTFEGLVQEIVRTHDHNFHECSVALKEFYARALREHMQIMPIWLDLLIREVTGAARAQARADEQKRIKELIRKS